LMASPAGHEVPPGAGSNCAEVEGRLTIITMSHFLPHPELQYSRGVAELGKAVGCTQLLSQLQQVRLGGGGGVCALHLTTAAAAAAACMRARHNTHGWHLTCGFRLHMLASSTTCCRHC
jgi:hypothetical protein